MYYVSFCINMDHDWLEQLRKSLLYSNVIVRYEIFKMNSNQEFWIWKTTRVTKIIDSRDDKSLVIKYHFYHIRKTKIY